MANQTHLFPSSLVIRHQKLLSKPLKDFSVEDLRLMLSQNTELKFLMPIVMEILEKDLFAEGDYYEGDLLMATLQSDSVFWLENSNLRCHLISLIEQNFDNLLNFDTTYEIKRNLINAYEKFNGLQTSK